jgi:hypothetical protein
MVEKYIKSNICPLPWTHLEVDVNGSASPCCLYKGTINDYKVYDTDLKTIQDSDYMNDLRQQISQWRKTHRLYQLLAGRSGGQGF